MYKISCFGEVLWDMLPTGKKVGGAPLNVALRMRSLGNDTQVISSLGNDANGEEILNILKELDMPTDYIQKHTGLDTSIVQVNLDDKGAATYTIKYPCAWDEIAYTNENAALVRSSDAFIFGSLASRDKTSKSTLFRLLEDAKFKVFDINLRAPHYTLDLILDLSKKADFIKFNDDELNVIMDFLGQSDFSIEEGLAYLAKETETSLICVTLGDKGAILYCDGQFYSNPGYKIEVVDTVGSGDSFLASLTSKLLQNIAPQDAIDFACAIGAMVAKSAGANPTFSDDEVVTFIKSYE